MGKHLFRLVDLTWIVGRRMDGQVLAFGRSFHFSAPNFQIVCQRLERNRWSDGTKITKNALLLAASSCNISHTEDFTSEKLQKL